MTEIEIIAHAQKYLEKLANGINPLTNEEVAESDVINNVRISRCLFYTSGILKQIVDNKGKFKVEMPDREEFTITPEQLTCFEYSEIPISVSEITKRINSLVNTLHAKELKNGVITKWLTTNGMLSTVIINNKERKTVSDSGKGIGIIEDERESIYGRKYTVILYSLNAQHFIIDNIDAIIALNREKAKK